MMKHILDVRLQDAASSPPTPRASPLSRRRWRASTWPPRPPSPAWTPRLLRAAAVAFAQAGAAAIFVGLGPHPGSAGGRDRAAPPPTWPCSPATSAGRARVSTRCAPGANSQGLIDMGVRPDRLPGGARGDSTPLAQARSGVGRRPGGSAPGVALADLVPAIEAGDHQGPVRGRRRPGAGPGRRRADAQAALAKLDVLVVQDSLPDRHRGQADVVLRVRGGLRRRGHLHQRRAVRAEGPRRGCPRAAPACPTGPSSRCWPTLWAPTGSTRPGRRHARDRRARPRLSGHLATPRSTGCRGAGAVRER